jgi:hypothetical protein
LAHHSGTISHDHHEPHHHHGSHHGPAGSTKGDAFKIGSILVFLFLCSLAAHYLFAEEALYDWSQNRQNAHAAQDIQPNSGDTDAP